MAKHSKLFYRAIARIRALNVKDGAVLGERVKKIFKISLIRAYKLKEELVKAGAVRDWKDSDFKDLPIGKKTKGNIVWKNMSKFRVPKEITKEETLRVKEELKSGRFPKTLADISK